MKTTIDAAGRIVVPKKIREAVQIEPGSELEVRVQNGIICLEPLSGPVKFKKRGHLVVATRAPRDEVLTAEVVEATREAIRGERDRSAVGRTSRP